MAKLPVRSPGAFAARCWEAAISRKAFGLFARDVLPGGLLCKIWESSHTIEGYLEVGYK